MPRGIASQAKIVNSTGYQRLVTAIEEQLYRPANIEKILAWGGLASVKHVTRYIQPGLELISLDPKRSASIIGPEVFTDDELLADAARRAATDIGALNQLGCVNARVIYVITGAHVAMLIGAMVFVALAAFRALAGQYTSRQSDGIQAASYFWYATMLMYTLIYFGIYVTK